MCGAAASPEAASIYKVLFETVDPVGGSGEAVLGFVAAAVILTLLFGT